MQEGERRRGNLEVKLAENLLSIDRRRMDRSIGRETI
jgi:hypothetical protein